MKAIAIGLGSIGQRHFNNLHTEYPNIELLAYRQRDYPLKFLDEKLVKSYHSLELALDEKPDIAFITNPSSMHIPISIELAKQGCHLFIEKPLSNNLDGIDELIDIVKQKKLTTFIGCNLRFHKCIKIIKQCLYDNMIGDVISSRVVFGTYLPDWHPWEYYKDTYAARKDLGGGVILTSIHELDYLYWLFGEVKEVTACKGKNILDIDVEDNIDAFIRFKTDVVANVHLDFYSKPYRRECDIIGTKGTLKMNFIENSVNAYTDSRWNPIYTGTKEDFNNTYIEELHHFIDSVKNGKKTINDISDGKKVLEMALAIKESYE